MCHRATNGPSGFVLEPLYDEDGRLKTRFIWVLNIDMALPSVMPTSLLDKMMPLSMTKYIKQLKVHIEDIKSGTTEAEEDEDYDE